MFIKTGKEKEQDIPGTSESREHSKNQEIQILRNHNKWRGESKKTHWRIKAEVWGISRKQRLLEQEMISGRRR